MSIKNYGQLVTQLADNTSGAISPQDVREIVESLATKYLVATYDPGAPVGSTPTAWTKVPVTMTAYPTAKTNGLSESSSVFTFRDPGLYIVLYRLAGSFTTAALIRSRLYATSGTPAALPFSSVSESYSGADDFTLTGAYMLNVSTANTTVQMEYQTAAVETWNSPTGFFVTFSLPPIYGGA